MPTVTLQMRPSRITAIMTAARLWLDAHGMMPSMFHYDSGDDKMLIVKIQFAADEEADAFAGGFCRASADEMKS
jgi:hypothetical protein